MDIFSIITLLGGLAFFLYGMNTMSAGLEKMTGGKLEKGLKKLTSNKWKALLLGAGITIAIQSSSAMTVMLVGFVNSGIMQLSQTIGVIMGSNIGTTLTAWILSLTGIKSDNLLLNLCNPEVFSPILALIGVLMMMLSKKSKHRDIGNIMLGFTVLMFGMNLMSSAVSPLADMPEFTSVLLWFKNPFLGVLIGTVFTGIIQSSAASIGILQALSLTGGISYGMAIPIIMGQNIGTCVTALISSIGVNKSAKKVAVVHIYFNIIGTAICLSIYLLTAYVLNLSFVDKSISPFGIAIAHSIFNVVTTMVLLPFTTQLETLANMTVKERGKVETTFLDGRLLNTPSVAISACGAETLEMSKLVQEMLKLSLDTLQNYKKEKLEKIEEMEQKTDQYEDSLGSYLVKLSSKELSDADSKEISKVLHVIGDFERMAAHALNLAKVGEELFEKELSFSNQAEEEVTVLTNAIREIVDITVKALADNNVALAQHVEPLEQIVDVLKGELKNKHIMRLKSGICTVEQGFIFNDLLTNCERISDHCSNIAVCIIQVNDASFDTHEYLQTVKTTQEGIYKEMYLEYEQKYILGQI